MRNELMQRINAALIEEGIENNRISSRVLMILSDYEISARETEVVIYDGDSVDRFLKMFLITKRVSGRSERTLKHYKLILQQFFEVVGCSPAEVRPDHIKLFLAHKEIDDNVSKVYLDNIMRVIGSFYKWMAAEEYIAKDPLGKIDRIKIPRRKKHALSEVELELMRRNISNLRDRAIFEVMLSTWCRVSEIVSMDRAAVNADGSCEIIGKGNKLRKVYLNAKAQVALDDYLKSRTDNNAALFVCERKPHNRLSVAAIEKMIKNLGQISGVALVHPHRFRRTGATMALKRGMPIEKVSKLLGHESIDTTQIYLDVSEEEIAQAHRKYA